MRKFEWGKKPGASAVSAPRDDKLDATVLGTTKETFYADVHKHCPMHPKGDHLKGQCRVWSKLNAEKFAGGPSGGYRK